MSQEGYFFEEFKRCHLRNDNKCFDHVAENMIDLLFDHCQESPHGIPGCALKRTTFKGMITRGPFVTTTKEHDLIKDNVHDKQLLCQKIARFYQEKHIKAARLEEMRRAEAQAFEDSINSFCMTSHGVIDYMCANMARSDNWDQ